MVFFSYSTPKLKKIQKQETKTGSMPESRYFPGRHWSRVSQIPVDGPVTHIVEVVCKGYKLMGCFAQKY